jgi:glycosyltransferase involved in cell wall biosynthesis
MFLVATDISSRSDEHYFSSSEPELNCLATPSFSSRNDPRDSSMSNSLFDISLMICTRNRAAKLVRTLKRVSAMQSLLKWELIVVDNGSTDGTGAIVADYATACDHPLQMIFEQRPGVSNARNAGWHSARSGIIACIDDDCYPEGGYIDAVFECFSKDPKLGFVGGRILLHDPTDRRITIQESLEPLSFSPHSFIPAGVIQGANVAYRRAAIMDVNGFDPWFGSGSLYSGDELELVSRMLAAGWEGAYDPKPVVYHHHGRKTASDERRIMRWYDRGRGARFAKCILDRRIRDIYVKNWFATRKYHSWRTSAREFVAGLEYIARRSLVKSHPTDRDRIFCGFYAFLLSPLLLILRPNRPMGGGDAQRPAGAQRL